jgi:hypothetical protein
VSRGPLIDYGRMLELLQAEARLLVAAAQGAPPDSPTVGVSGRTLGETVRYAGDLCEDVLSWLGASEEAARRWTVPNDPTIGQLTSRFALRLAELLEQLRVRSPEDPCPSWCPVDRTVRFWARHVLHSTTVQRVDVQTAAGVEISPIDEDAALDGIDETLRVWFGHRLNALGIVPSKKCSVAVSSGGRNWLVTTGPEVAVVDGSDVEAPAAADAVVTGVPQRVCLWLRGRLPNHAVSTGGDPDAVAQLWGLLQVCTK